MLRSTLTALLVLAVVPFQAAAAREIVTAAEIETLLSGNTILGTWNGEEYKQYFIADGVTIYAPKRSQSTRGKWRVNAKQNTYESWWEQSGWSAYKIVRQGDALFWTNTEGKDAQPFTVLPGEQLAWPQE